MEPVTQFFLCIMGFCFFITGISILISAFKKVIKEAVREVLKQELKPKQRRRTSSRKIPRSV